MNSVHFVLQGKGGVGKSLIAALLAQYFKSDKQDLLCADTDSVNDTFSRYEYLKPTRINIINSDKNIDARAFDGLVEMLMGHSGVAVIDNGASTFVPLSAYLRENEVIKLLEDAGKKVFIHTVLTGGQAMMDTIIGLSSLIETQSAPIVVWENEFFGEVAQNGIAFSKTTFYEENKERIKAILTLSRRNPDTFGKDLEVMVREKLTFHEAIEESEKFGIMPRQRLKIMRNDIFEQIANVDF